MRDDRPARPPAEPVAEERGLDDGIWSVIESCWQKDHDLRPYIKNVRERVEGYYYMAEEVVQSDANSVEMDAQSDTSSVEMEAYPS